MAARAVAVPARNGYVPPTIMMNGAVTANVSDGPWAAVPHSRLQTSAKQPVIRAADGTSTPSWPTSAAST